MVGYLRTYIPPYIPRVVRWMGIGERIKGIFRRRSPEAVEVEKGGKKYELRVMGSDGGWYSTGIVFDKIVSHEEAAQYIQYPGRYWLVEVEPGKPGFRKAWDKPLEVRYEEPVEEEEKPKKQKVKGNPLGELFNLAMAIASDEETKKAFAESIKILKRIFVGPDLEDALETLDTYREKLKKASWLIGESTGYKEEEGPEYEGKIPAYLHPKVLKGIRETIKETVKDIKKELIGETEGIETPKFPEEPKPKEVERKEEEKEEEEGNEPEGEGEG